MIYVIDAYAWVEYFAGTEKGAKACAIIESDETVITSAVTIGELASKFARSGTDFSAARKVLESLSKVEIVDADAAAGAGLLHAELRKQNKHIGLADAFVLHLARKHGAKVVTGDQDFKGLKNVVMI